MDHTPPVCCGEAMKQLFCPTVNITQFYVGRNYPRWVDRMDDIHKAQEQKGERLRMVHPSEVGATDA